MSGDGNTGRPRDPLNPRIFVADPVDRLDRRLRHTSGGMCSGEPPEGSECYCVLFPPDDEAEFERAWSYELAVMREHDLNV